MGKLGFDELQLEPQRKAKFWRSSSFELKKQDELKVSSKSPDNPYDVDSYAACGAAAATVIKGLASKEYDSDHEVLKQASSSSDLLDENNVEGSKKCAASNISNIENEKPENSYSHPKPFSSSTLEMNENYFSPQNNFSPQPSQVHSTTEDFNLKVEDVRTLLPAYMKNLCATISP